MPKDGADEAAIPNTDVKKRVELKGKDRPEISLSVPQAIDPTIIPAWRSRIVSAFCQSGQHSGKTSPLYRRTTGPQPPS
jgi:hypothetical protein